MPNEPETSESDSPFDSATFYTCDDSCEELSLETVEEAIEEMLDGWFIHDPRTTSMTPDEAIETQGPITVYAYKRKTLPDSFGFGEAAIDSMLEDFDEMYWCDEYGNAHDDNAPPWEGDVLKDVKRKLYATMEECMKLANIWRCEVVEERVFSEMAITAMMMEHRPDWWQKT